MVRLLTLALLLKLSVKLERGAEFPFPCFRFRVSVFKYNAWLAMTLKGVVFSFPFV